MQSCLISKQYSAVCIGHVTIGGSVCMQMLTRSGWSPSNDIEVSLKHTTGLTTNSLLVFFSFPLQSILIQVRAEIMSDQKARLDHYPESEARVVFERMVQRYGWNR